MTNLSDLFPAGAGKQVAFTASGNVSAAGKPVILNSDGTVSQVAESTASGSLPLGSRVTVESSASSIMRLQCTADPHNTNRWLVSYYNDSGTSGIRFRFVIRSGTSLSVGNEINSGGVSGINNAYNHAIAFDPSTADKFVMLFMPGSNAPSAYGTAAVVGTISGSAGSESISWGTPNRFETANFDASNGTHNRFQAIGTTGNYLAAWANDPSAVKMRVVTVSGTTVTAPGSTTIPYSTQPRNSSEFIFKVNPYDSSKALLFQNNHSTKNLYITDIALSGSTITATSSGNAVETSYTYENNYYNMNLVYLTSTKFVLAATRDTNVSVVGQGFQRIGNLSGGSFSYGSWVTHNVLTGDNALKYSFMQMLDNSTVTPDKWITIWTTNSSGGSYDKHPFGRIGSYSGDAVSFGTNTTMDSYAYQSIFVAKADDADGHFLLLGDNGSSSAYVFLGKTGGTSSNLTSTNFLGISDAAISNSASGNITIKGGIAATGLSSLTPGSDYYATNAGAIATSGDVKIGKALSATAINLEYQS